MTKQNERISVEAAAKVLGIGPNQIRHGLRNGTLPIGIAQRTEGTSKHYRYLVFRNLVMKFAGLEEWPE